MTQIYWFFSIKCVNLYMQYESNSVEEYLDAIPEDRREALTKIRNLLSDNIPSGFEETLGF